MIFDYETFHANDNGKCHKNPPIVKMLYSFLSIYANDANTLIKWTECNALFYLNKVDPGMFYTGLLSPGFHNGSHSSNWFQTGEETEFIQQQNKPDFTTTVS